LLWQGHQQIVLLVTRGSDTLQEHGKALREDTLQTQQFSG
jgi:hypothetical protein